MWSLQFCELFRHFFPKLVEFMQLSPRNLKTLFLESVKQKNRCVLVDKGKPMLLLEEQNLVPSIIMPVCVFHASKKNTAEFFLFNVHLGAKHFFERCLVSQYPLKCIECISYACAIRLKPGLNYCVTEPTVLIFSLTFFSLPFFIHILSFNAPCAFRFIIHLTFINGPPPSLLFTLSV